MPVHGAAQVKGHGKAIDEEQKKYLQDSFERWSEFMVGVRVLAANTVPEPRRAIPLALVVSKDCRESLGLILLPGGTGHVLHHNHALHVFPLRVPVSQDFHWAGAVRCRSTLDGARFFDSEADGLLLFYAEVLAVPALK